MSDNDENSETLKAWAHWTMKNPLSQDQKEMAKAINELFRREGLAEERIRDMARDHQEAARCWQIERADLTKQLEAAKLRVVLLEVEREMETIANTKTVFRGNEVIKRYEAAEAENARLRAALEEVLDRWEYNLSIKDEPIFERAKAALAGEEDGG